MPHFHDADDPEISVSCSPKHSEQPSDNRQFFWQVLANGRARRAGGTAWVTGMAKLYWPRAIPEGVDPCTRANCQIPLIERAKGNL